ncbi:MAG: bifunctional DNA primase/polymerase [Thermodesulfobacteriota bacterium]
MNRLKAKNDTDSPETRRKIGPEDVCAGIRPDELGQILNLKKNLDYSDVLSKYAGRYLQIGWDLVAVNPKGAVDLDLDFRQPQSLWSKRLSDLGLQGVQVNLGVRTGAASNLLVLEVRPGEGERPFAGRDDWRSGCVAEVAGGWEQHYYVLPQGWTAPASCFLDAHRLMVFGNGGLVLAPPSLEPRVQENLRWLRPPWESPPCRPSPQLWQFLKEQIPDLTEPPKSEDPAPPAWEEIYGTISAHPVLLQTLLAPTADAGEYYLQVLHTALQAGLTDPHILLGLLWHAPLGDARHRPRGLQELQNLIAATQKEQSQAAMARVTTLIQELQGAFAALGAGSQGPAAPPSPASSPGQAPPTPVSYNYTPPQPGTEAWQGPPGKVILPPRDQNLSVPEVYEHPTMRVLWRSRENIMVERDRYEAMLYELGKLGAWYEIQKNYSRENKALKEKIDSQQQKEISRLRRLCTQNQNQKKDKGWWR